MLHSFFFQYSYSNILLNTYSIMRVFDHLILDTEIIGISPLAIHGSANVAKGRIQYSFRIYTKSNTILITSPDFLSEDEQWRDRYFQVRELVAAQIQELKP